MVLNLLDTNGSRVLRPLAEGVDVRGASSWSPNDEWIVIGGHLDHLGRGKYGMRDPKRAGEIHPGADDNASGSAAVLMLADKLVQSYAEMPPGMPARSILFIN